MILFLITYDWANHRINIIKKSNKKQGINNVANKYIAKVKNLTSNGYVIKDVRKT